MSDRTKLVALSHIQFTCGLRMPIGEITEAAHSMGIPVLVDGAQSFGHVEVNLNDLGVRLLRRVRPEVAYGPVGTGALYVGREHRDMLEPCSPPTPLRQAARTVAAATWAASPWSPTTPD